MTPRERILRTLRGEPLDRIARGEFLIADEFASAFSIGVAGDALEYVVTQLNLDRKSVV